MAASGEDLAGARNLWTCWLEIEAEARKVGRRSRLSAADVEVALSCLLAKYLRMPGVEAVRHPKAWARKVFAQELGRIRRQPRAAQLIGEVASTAGDGDGHAVDEDLDGFRVHLAAHEQEVRSLLSRAETAVYDAVRAGLPLAGCAESCGMTVRDTRVRFRRICRKVQKIWPGFVPSPLYVVEAARGGLRQSASTYHVPATSDDTIAEEFLT
jgi:hypothetical protein